MTRTSKPTKILIVVMAMMMLLSTMAIFASASNADSGFTFSFSGYMDRTGIRQKDNDTSMYMYCTSTSTPYIASARGTYNGSTFYDCSYDWDDPTPTKYTYQFTSGIKRFMYNYVLENGFTYCAISANTSSNGSASGYWSPDSVYESGIRPASDYIK